MFSIAILSPPFYPTFIPLFAANSRKYQQQSKKAILLLNEAQALLIRAFFDKTSLWKMVGLGGLEPPTSPLSEGSAIADKPYSKAFYTIWEIHYPIFTPI